MFFEKLEKGRLDMGEEHLDDKFVKTYVFEFFPFWLRLASKFELLTQLKICKTKI